MSTSHNIPIENIHDIIKNYKTKNFQKINVYGVLTYNGANSKTNKCISITIVDDSCKTDEKLKCIVFKTNNEKYIDKCSELGDIVRLNRIKIQDFNGQAQGVVNGTFSSWVVFKNDSQDFNFECSNPNSTIDDEDKNRVKQLRDWLKTNPQLNALFEANLSSQLQISVNLLNQTDPNENQLELAAQVMNMQSNENNLEPQASKIVTNKLTSFENIQKDSYFDFVCQICAICDSKGVKILLVWDSTKSNLAVHQENDFNIESTLASAQTAAANSDYKNKVLFSKNILDQIFQVYIFDEFISKLDNLEPGDFILLKNAKTSPAPNNSGADLLIKMPGVANHQQKYGRALIKLASYRSFEQEQSLTSNPEIDKLIQKIYEKGKELDLKFINEDEFKNEYTSGLLNSQNDTFAELFNDHSKPNQKEAIKPQSILTQVNNLMEDDTRMYITDDESENSNDHEQQNVIQTLVVNQNIINIQATMEVEQLNVKKTPEKNKNHNFPSPNPKRAKKINQNETCPDIFKLKKLTNLTYLVPHLISPSGQELTKTLPFYTSIKHLIDDIKEKPYIKCKLISKLFNYSISSCPVITSVFVNCKKCKYINFVPFHLASIYQQATLYNYLNNFEQIENSTQIPGTNLMTQFMGPSLETIQTDDNFNDKLFKNAMNFNLDWLQSVLPDNSHSINPTQGFTQSTEDESIVSFHYSCPRCLLNQIENECENEADSTLEYVYRFWFILRDADGRLDPCLMESDMAERFLDGIKPIKFFTNQLKSHQIYKIIHKNFDKKFLFSIEAFNLNFNNENEQDVENQKDMFIPTIVNSNSKKLDYLYRIVSMDELVSK